MPPTDAIAIVSLEHVMIVMVTLTVGEEGEKAIVSCAVGFGIGSAPPIVSQGINEKGHVMVHHQTQQPDQQQRADHIAVPEA